MLSPKPEFSPTGTYTVEAENQLPQVVLTSAWMSVYTHIHTSSKICFREKSVPMSTHFPHAPNYHRRKPLMFILSVEVLAPEVSWRRNNTEPVLSRGCSILLAFLLAVDKGSNGPTSTPTPAFAQLCSQDLSGCGGGLWWFGTECLSRQLTGDSCAHGP